MKKFTWSRSKTEIHIWEAQTISYFNKSRLEEFYVLYSVPKALRTLVQKILIIFVE